MLPTLLLGKNALEVIAEVDEDLSAGARVLDETIVAPSAGGNIGNQSLLAKDALRVVDGFLANLGESTRVASPKVTTKGRPLLTRSAALNAIGNLDHANASVEVRNLLVFVGSIDITLFSRARLLGLFRVNDKSEVG